MGTKKNESLMKYEQNLLEEHKSQMHERNPHSFNFNESEILESDPALKSNMNDLSKLLCEKFKDSTKKITKYSEAKKEQKIGEEGLKNLNSKLNSLKKILNKK